jgi:hypothetical protein
MTAPLEALLDHDNTDECVACRARDFAEEVLIPAVAAWEASADLPPMALGLHGAVGLLGAMLAAGVPREELDESVSRLLDEIETQSAEDRALGGPAQGTA